MTTTLSNFQIACSLLAQLQKTEQGKVVSIDGVGLAPLLGSQFAHGTAALQADKLILDVNRAILSAADETLDVYDLAGFASNKDLLGNAITLAEIVALVIFNRPASAGVLKVGGDGTAAAWNSIFDGDDDAVLPILPGGWLNLVAPADPAYAVADTTNHLLKMAAAGGNVAYDIAILGRSS